MTDDRRNKLAAIMAEGDQNNAHYRDWLHSLSMEELDEMYSVTRGLYVTTKLRFSPPLQPSTLGVIAMARHVIVEEMTRRAELEVGGGE